MLVKIELMSPNGEESLPIEEFPKADKIHFTQMGFFVVVQDGREHQYPVGRILSYECDHQKIAQIKNGVVAPIAKA